MISSNIREISTHTIRKTVIYHVGLRDLPRIRAALLAVCNLITRHDEFDMQHAAQDFAFTIAEAIAYDTETWKPWAKAIFTELAELTHTGQITTRLDFIDAWSQIIDSIDNVMDCTYNQPVSSAN